ncbi:site-2 protease family protein [Streptomyces sp. NBC_00663]|uniref:site-2 protease family protein n=1 Tax=Streptomyces sp. NBC_00663 TaxID=2975801 RepID=UPI002E34D052|nr:site-2 protease family protein [Streptomyces sp. NBC_00663]
MDESGGSGQPRSGNDEPTQHAGPTAPAADPATPPPPAPEQHPADAADTDADTDAGAADEAATEAPSETETPQTDGTSTAPNTTASPAPPTPTEAPPAEGTKASPTGDTDTSPTGNTDTSPSSDTDVSPTSDTDASPTGGTAAPASPADTPASPPRAPAEHTSDRAAAESTSDAEARRQDKATEDDAAADGATDTRPPVSPTASAPSSTTDAHPAPNNSTPQDHRTLAHSGTTKGRPPRRPRDPGGGLLMGRPFGVPVYVAPSWFLVAALITWVFGGQLDRVLPELGAARYLVSLFFAVAFYASVLIHELAHTVAALRFKLPVRRIQLQFFGGVSEIEKEAETPGREFVLAFVGPLLSLVLAGVFYVALQPVEPGTVPGVLLAGLMISNLIVAAFNLLPGLPLDGGRMLRAVVWKITGKPMSGTIAAAWVGRALAVSVLIGLPLLTQSGALGSNAEDNVGMDTVMDALLAAILAAIIWTGAGNSLRMARLREHLPELRARNLTRRAVPVETDTPLSEALRRANEAGARALVVVDADGEPLSLVREAAIVGVPEHRRPWVAVSGLAQDLTDGMRVSAELAGEDLLDTLRATPATEYLVIEDTGEIYGVLSAADVERAFVKAMARPS